jgi:hypothetical protein
MPQLKKRNVKFVLVLVERNGHHGVCVEQMTLIYFMKKMLFKKLMIRFLLGKSITFCATRALINEFTVPPTILVLSQLNPYHNLVPYFIQNNF